MGGKRPTVDAYFGTEAEDYGKSKWMMRNQQKTTVRVLRFLESDRLGGLLPLENQEYLFLDIGCGTGYSSEVLLGSGFRVIGFDISFDMLNQAIDHSNYHKILADMRYQPFRNSKFDNAISISAFNFASEGVSKKSFAEGIEASINEIERCIISEGRIVIEFYPTEKEREQFLISLKKSSFDGGMLIENQGTRKEKKFLLLISKK